VTAIDGAVFSGSLDGYLRAYDSTSGKVIWEYDTRNTYDSVNGIKAMGGSLNGPGPAIAAGHLYVNSGYGMWNMWLPGNALIAFSVNGE
jgi:polyvinyl alcohol dehydrogenase (cytochrome)